MKERPITFSAALIPEIIHGRKTETRRVTRYPLPDDAELVTVFRERAGVHVHFGAHAGYHVKCKCPFGMPGDRLWVREPYRFLKQWDHLPPSKVPEHSTIFYSPMPETMEILGGGMGRYRHARFMPRKFSRITLEVQDVGIERVQDITDGAAMCEGYPKDSSYGPRHWFQLTWDELHRGRGCDWDVNPWVWVVKFKNVS